MAVAHYIEFGELYLEMIKSGRKTVEDRTNTACNRHLLFFNGNPDCAVLRLLPCVVTYKSFRQMLSREAVKKCLPNIDNISNGVLIYHQFPHYKPKSRRLDVIAFRSRLVE